jgi:hypothetical protein
LLSQLASTIKIKKVQKVVKKLSKKLSKSCQKVFKTLSKSCRKLSKNVKKLSKFSLHLVKTKKGNGAIVEKVGWCNSKKRQIARWCNRKKVNGKNKNKKKIIGIP